MPRKPGVAEPSELASFVKTAGDKLIVIDARNPAFTEESAELGPLAPHPSRPRSVNIPFDKGSNTMDLSLLPQEWVAAGSGPTSVPIITHCGGGGRGQKAKEFCLEAGFGNVLNGGGPEDEECWAQFRDK